MKTDREIFERSNQCVTEKDTYSWIRDNDFIVNASGCAYVEFSFDDDGNLMSLMAHE